ncbi:MAG: OsmC family protein [Anaerolineae bacterium]|uniref:OsmC family protein n=1 Tax=Promineifilum sp. TaxID=2664178 RepID=UPI001D3BF49C|nr:OsmC family protein [Anaerolineales bacterium]MCB8934224.1 OsmC family protein [Promineifilum sp.]MCO5179845.1 OsmC family protein [Promineifilum sp.]MCW5845595.1 OsmC family protein [Anaerolineae bacterium]
MKITAHVQNSHNHHHITLSTNDTAHTIPIPPKSSGYGSSANGGELLFLALATCYCNDIYREAAKRGIEVTAVAVTVDGDFGAAGEPARNVTYSAKVTGRGSAAELEALMQHTDTVAEIQNTLRAGASVILENIEVESLSTQ